MITVRQWNLYNLLPWPEYITGRDLAKNYERDIGQRIAYADLYLDMRQLVKLEFAESKDEEDEDGKFRTFRKKANGKRPEKPKKLKKENLEQRILPQPA